MRRLIHLPACLALLGLGLAGCATTSPEPSTTLSTVDRSGDIVIAADGEGIGTSWSSVTDSPLARTAAELSNIGGTPAVLGAVGVVMVADAAPRGRARRLSEALNAGIDPEALDRDLAERIEAALPDAPELDGPVADVRIETFERNRDLANEGYIVETDYAVAKDGRALRVEADIVHAEVLRVEAQIRREWRRLEMSNSDFGTRPNSRRLRKLNRDWIEMQSLYRGKIVYHSDPVEPASISPDETVPSLTEILELERSARQATARARYKRDMADATKPRHESRAQRRLDKSLAKAESLHAKGLEKAADDEISKMETLLVALEAWQEETDSDQSRLRAEIENAHAFIAQGVAVALSDLDPEEAFQSADTDETQPLPTLDGLTLLDRDEEGRLVYVVTDGPQTGTLISEPETGMADYGGAVARP